MTTKIILVMFLHAIVHLELSAWISLLALLHFNFHTMISCCVCFLFSTLVLPIKRDHFFLADYRSTVPTCCVSSFYQLFLWKLKVLSFHWLILDLQASLSWGNIAQPSCCHRMNCEQGFEKPSECKKSKKSSTYNWNKVVVVFDNWKQLRFSWGRNSTEDFVRFAMKAKGQHKLNKTLKFE